MGGRPGRASVAQARMNGGGGGGVPSRWRPCLYSHKYLPPELRTSQEIYLDCKNQFHEQQLRTACLPYGIQLHL